VRAVTQLATRSSGSSRTWPLSSTPWRPAAAAQLLWSHSYGANCAMGGAALTTNVHHLVLYEPSLGLAYPAGSIESIEQKVAAGDLEAALLEVLVGIAGMTEDEVDADPVRRSTLDESGW
jgi:hypothetical protein